MKTLKWFYDSIKKKNVYYKHQKINMNYLYIYFYKLIYWIHLGIMTIQGDFFKRFMKHMHLSVLLLIMLTWCHTVWSVVFLYNWSWIFKAATTLHSGKQKNERTRSLPVSRLFGSREVVNRALGERWLFHEPDTEWITCRKAKKGVWLFFSFLGLRGDEVRLAES